MATSAPGEPQGWRGVIPAGFRPYIEPAPLTALFLGISSGFPFALLAATLTQRLSEAGIEKKSISAFALALLIYSFKWVWAPLVDRVKLPGSKRFGQRRTWLWFASGLVAAAVVVLAFADPSRDIQSVVIGAIMLGFAGATFDIVIDAYRIETLEPRQLGVGSGMSQYGWRLGAFFAASIALFVASRSNWAIGYLACVPLAFVGPIASLFMGEPSATAIPSRCTACAPRSMRFGGRSPTSSNARAHSSFCCSCSSTRSATRWRTS